MPNMKVTNEKPKPGSGAFISNEDMIKLCDLAIAVEDYLNSLPNYTNGGPISKNLLNLKNASKKAKDITAVFVI